MELSVELGMVINLGRVEWFRAVDAVIDWSIEHGLEDDVTAERRGWSRAA